MGRRVASVLGIVVLVGGVVAFVHHVRGARFVAVAKPIEVSPPTCMALLTTQSYGFGSSTAKSICADTRDLPWFAFEVRNVGHRGAWMNRCFVWALDASGTVVYRTEVGFAGVGPPAGPAGPYLDPGDTFRYRWYSTAQFPKGTVNHFVAECPPIDYKGNVPA